MIITVDVNRVQQNKTESGERAMSPYEDQIKDLMSKVVQFRDERNWKQFRNPKDLSISLV